MSILIIIPARGGSKGIPRKNLRPLNGKPLIYYSIELTKNLNINADCYVSSDDEEILFLSQKFGIKTLKRDSKLSRDATTLDPVIFDAYRKASELNKKKYDIIVTLQPTSPLLKPETLVSAIKNVQTDDSIDSLLSVEDDTHLTWKKEEDRVIPNYEERVNRQQLPTIYKETGGFLITRSRFVTENNRLGKNVEVFPVQKPESIDIDTFEDFQLCEYFLKRKTIAIVTNGNKEIGLGHAYNTLSIANDLISHNLIFLVLKSGDLAKKKIVQYNYSVQSQQDDNLLEDLRAINPDIVINDILDTEADYIQNLKKERYSVINFEDLGEGAQYADLVFNAIYPEKEKFKNHYFGHKYFILRDEFYFTPEKKLTPFVKNILITFGGVDANNLTRKVLEAIYDFCQNNGIKITVVAGIGYDKYETITDFDQIEVKKNIPNISDYMHDADIIFTSAGRTTFEIASLGVPAIVMAQNEREATHLFASQKYGFEYLGLGSEIDKNDICKTFKKLCSDYELRKEMQSKMLKCDIKEGKNRTIKIINRLIHEM